jgi:hypothetical protein
MEEVNVLISKKLENEEWWTPRQSPMRSRCFFLPPHSADRCGIFFGTILAWAMKHQTPWPAVVMPSFG